MNQDEEGPQVIEVIGEMRTAWEAGAESYTPYFRQEAMDEECGTVEVSLKNLRRLVASGEKVCSILARPNGVLVCFCGGISYLATGFAVGKDAGMKVKGLAQFAAEVGLGNAEKILRHIAALPSDYEGELEFPVPGDLSLVK
jgi:hypothetical protein